MRKLASLAALLAAAAVSLPSIAWAEKEVDIYQGLPASEQNIVLGGWGSGLASERTGSTNSPTLTGTSPGVVTYSGSHVLQIATNGYYAGGRIDFNQPVDLTDAFSDRNTYLQIVVQFPGFTPPEDTYGFSGYGGGGYGTGTDTQTGPATQFMRVVMTVNGVDLMIEDHPVDFFNPLKVESGWTQVSIPLAAFKGPKPQGRALLSRIMLFGDKNDLFTVGAIRTVVDDEPISVEPIDDQAATVYDPTQWVAEANGGLATLEYVWDFDASDGLQEEAFGQDVRHVYRSASGEGGYRVTLTVRDIYGIKEPAVATAEADIYNF